MSVPAILKKKISFLRLSKKNCSAYQIYALYHDDKYASGIRKELLEEFENPSLPNPVIKSIQLEHKEEPTWELPKDIYMDRDHPLRLYQNGFIVSSMYYSINRVTRLLSVDTIVREYSNTDEMVLEYYRDVIIKEYVLEEDCDIQIIPIFKDTSVLGDHNIIM